MNKLVPYMTPARGGTVVHNFSRRREHTPSQCATPAQPGPGCVVGGDGVQRGQCQSALAARPARPSAGFFSFGEFNAFPGGLE